MAVTGDIFNIGTTALLNYQRVLATTSHNIANVDNDAYSRQRAEITSNIPLYSGAGFIGTGAHIATVERQYDRFLAKNLQDNIAAESRLDTYYRYASQMDDLLADIDVGLSGSVESFFNAVHDVANDPTSITARASVLAEGENLTDRFHYLNQSVADLRQHVETEMEQVVSRINALAENIANLNEDIIFNSGKGGGTHEPNDLLDQRDAAINELASLVKVTTYQQDDGAMNVFIGSGQNLVLGKQSQQLALTPNAYDGSYLEIAYSGSNTPLTTFMEGGKLGGLVDVRDDILEDVRNELGRIAVGIAETFNQQHLQGMDLNGDMGTLFFNAMDDASVASVQGPQFLPNTLTNAAATDVSGTLAFTDVTSLRASNYRLDYDGTNYSLTRLSDNTVVSTIAAAGFPQTLSFATEGFDLTLTGTSIAANDKFIIRPTYNGSADIGVRLTEPSEVAAAAPFRIDEATDALGNPTNTGSAVLSPGTLSNADADAAFNRLSDVLGSNQLSLTYGAATAGRFQVTTPGALPAGFDILDANGNSVLVGANEFVYNPATDSGSQYTLSLPGFGDIAFTITGSPDSILGGAAANDQFVIRDNAFDNAGASLPGGVGDGRNASLLAALQTSDTMLISGGVTDYQGVYGQLVANVGIQTSQAEINHQARLSLLEQAQEARDTVAGVNLDEEAAALIRYQQAYQAAAQVFTVGRDIFQTMLSAVGR